MIRKLRPYFAVLKNKDFTKLWISQICVQLTRYILSFAVLIQVFRLTESSFAVALILLAFGLATVFFGALAGVYSDRFDRRKLLTIINFGQAGVILCYIPFTDNFAMLALITFVYSSLNQFYLPSEAPSIPLLVPKEQLLIANSYFGLTSSASMIIGFALAAPITIWFGEKAPFLLGVFLMIVAGFATWFMPSLMPKHSEMLGKFTRNIWKDFKAGLNYLFSTRSLHFPFFTLFAAQLYNGMVITLAPAYVDNVLGLRLEEGTLFMIGPIGLGVLIGSLFLGIEGQIITKKRLIKAGFIILGVFTILISIVVSMENRWIYPFLAVFLGIANTHIFAPSHSILQESASDELRGRVYGKLFLLLQMAATLPTVLVGYMADIFSLTTILAALGLLCVGFAILLNASKHRKTG